MLRRLGCGALQRRELAREILVRGKQLAQLHEGAHHVDAHLDGAGTVQDGGSHDRAVLGEGERELATAAAAPF